MSDNENSKKSFSELFKKFFVRGSGKEEVDAHLTHKEIEDHLDNDELGDVNLEKSKLKKNKRLLSMLKNKSFITPSIKTARRVIADQFSKKISANANDMTIDLNENVVSSKSEEIKSKNSKETILEKGGKEDWKTEVVDHKKDGDFGRGK